MMPGWVKRSLLCALASLAGGAVLARPGEQPPAQAEEYRRYEAQPSERGDDRRERYRSLREDMMRQSAPQRAGERPPPREAPAEPGLRRLSPEERQQLRRDVRDAGRDVYGR
ncbi:MAG: hypothetical protein QM639_07005 [Rhodocyclaceae bacterium]|jgi:hypothetical protein